MGRIPEDDIARVREASDLMASSTRPSSCVSAAGCGGAVARSTPRRRRRSRSTRPRSSGTASAATRAATSSSTSCAATASSSPRPSASSPSAPTSRSTRRAAADRRTARRSACIAACEAAAEFFHRQLLAGRDAGSGAARDYLGSRGFGTETAKRCQLGYAPAGQRRHGQGPCRAGVHRRGARVGQPGRPRRPTASSRTASSTASCSRSRT